MKKGSVSVLPPACVCALELHPQLCRRHVIDVPEGGGDSINLANRHVVLLEVDTPLPDGVPDPRNLLPRIRSREREVLVAVHRAVERRGLALRADANRLKAVVRQARHRQHIIETLFGRVGPHLVARRELVRGGCNRRN